MKKTIENGETFVLPWGTTIIESVDGKDRYGSTRHRMTVTPVTSGELSITTRRAKIIMNLCAIGMVVLVVGGLVWVMQGLVVVDGTNMMEACTAMGGDQLRVERDGAGEKVYTCLEITELGVLPQPAE